MKARSVAVIAMTTALSAGCSMFMGQDGEDGDVYIAYSWVVGPFTWWTNDPALAGEIYIINGRYYPALPGTYDFQYQSWDGSVWEGSYTIYVDEGKPGMFFTDGADGEDLYFELLCLSTGPSLYVWSYPYARRVDGRSGASVHGPDDYRRRTEAERRAAGAAGVVVDLLPGEEEQAPVGWLPPAMKVDGRRNPPFGRGEDMGEDPGEGAGDPDRHTATTEQVVIAGGYTVVVRSRRMRGAHARDRRAEVPGAREP